MDPESSGVVSDSTEQTATADTASTASTQTEDTSTATTDQTPKQETAQEKRDYRKLQKEDADLNAHVQREIQKALQKRERQQLRQTAKAAADQGDTVAALSIAQRIASEVDDDDDGLPNSAQWRSKADKVQPHLDRLLRLDDSGAATNPYYVKLYEKVGQAELDKRYAKDPAAFVDWLDDQLTELRVDDMLRKKAPSLYEAGKLDGQNTALQNAPKPLGGGTGSNPGLTLQQYESMSSAERMKLKRENPKLIDDMVARYA